ncbi:MAG: hypothetical protein WEF86_04345 [Gemmatimonadota bacterium]
MEDIVGDSANTIWTLAWRVNDDAERFVAAALEEAGDTRRGLGVALQDSVYDYYLDRVDLRSGCSTGTARLTTGTFKGFVAPGYLYSLRELSNGMLVIDTWRAVHSQFNRSGPDE